MYSKTVPHTVSYFMDHQNYDQNNFKKNIDRQQYKNRKNMFQPALHLFQDQELAVHNVSQSEL